MMMLSMKALAFLVGKGKHIKDFNVGVHFPYSCIINEFRLIETQVGRSVIWPLA